MLDGQPYGSGGDLRRLDDQRVRLCPRHEPAVAQVGPVGERLGDRFEAGRLGGPQQLRVRGAEDGERGVVVGGRGDHGLGLGRRRARWRGRARRAV